MKTNTLFFYTQLIFSYLLSMIQYNNNTIISMSNVKYLSSFVSFIIFENVQRHQ